jgi:hypothetical protein
MVLRVNSPIHNGHGHVVTGDAARRAAKASLPHGMLPISNTAEPEDLAGPDASVRPEGESQ